MRKLSLDEKTFLDRVCFRLFGSPLKWRSLLKSGMKYDEIYSVLINKTHEQRATQKPKLEEIYEQNQELNPKQTDLQK